MKQPKLPSLSKVKLALYRDWALRVKQRDGWICVACGNTDNLTAHHWYVCDHHAHAARYCVHNGATLCYTCHIRGVHFRADWTSVQRIANAVRMHPEFDEQTINELSRIELTTESLRSAYDLMQSRPILFGDCTAVMERKKLSCRRFEDHISAVPGNTVHLPGMGTFEVTTVTPDDNGNRYGLKPFVKRERT